MGYENDRLIGLSPDAQQVIVELFPCEFVQRRKRFVHQQDLRLDRKRSGDSHTLLHTAGKLLGIVVCKLGQIHKLQHFLCLFHTVCLRHFHDLQRHFHIFLHSAPVIKHCALEHDAIAPL